MKEVLQGSQEGFNDVSKKFNGEVPKVFQGCFKKVSRVNQRRLKGVSIEF